jgi:hypothetical protein
MIQGIGPHGLISPGSCFIGIVFPKKARKLLIVGIAWIIGYFRWVVHHNVTTTKAKRETHE